MKRLLHVLPVGGLFVLAAWLSQGVACAQFYNPYMLYNQNRLAQQSWYMQQMASLQAYQGQLATYQTLALSNGNGGVYSPYFNAGFNPGAYYAPGFGGAGWGGMNPYMGNPYAPTGAGYGIGNPYSPMGGDMSNPYASGLGYGAGLGYGGIPGYGPGYGAGQVLMGSADVMRSYGKVINDQEQARVTREKALQEQLNTKKQKFDLNMYMAANTPTYSQEQERTRMNTLRRIQINSTPSELANGKALNFLLDDLRKFPNKKIALEPLPVSEGILTRLNVTKNIYGLGLLRDDGKVTWPTALLKQMKSEKHRKDLDGQFRDLVNGAYMKRLDRDLLAKLKTEMEQMRDELVKNVNEVPFGQYTDAKRFLQEFQEASIALDRGEAPVQADFQRFIEGGKDGRPIQEVVDYMVKNGLRFGPAAANDEPAYRAVHSVLATYDIAMNSAAGVDTKEP